MRNSALVWRQLDRMAVVFDGGVPVAITCRRLAAAEGASRPASGHERGHQNECCKSVHHCPARRITWRPRPSVYASSALSAPILSRRYRPSMISPSLPLKTLPRPSLRTATRPACVGAFSNPMSRSVIAGGGGGPCGTAGGGGAVGTGRAGVTGRGGGAGLSRNRNGLRSVSAASARGCVRSSSRTSATGRGEDAAVPPAVAGVRGADVVAGPSGAAPPRSDWPTSTATPTAPKAMSTRCAVGVIRRQPGRRWRARASPPATLRPRPRPVRHCRSRRIPARSRARG